MTDDIGNILKEKGLLLAKGKEYQVRGRLLLPIFSHAHIPGLALGFWVQGVEMTENVAELVSASRSATRGGDREVGVEMEKRFSLATLEMICSSGSDYKFCVLKSASISDSRNTGENSGSGLADAHCNIRHEQPISNHGDPIRNISLQLSVALPPFVGRGRGGVQAQAVGGQRGRSGGPLLRVIMGFSHPWRGLGGLLGMCLPG